MSKCLWKNNFWAINHSSWCIQTLAPALCTIPTVYSQEYLFIHSFILNLSPRWACKGATAPVTSLLFNNGGIHRASRMDRKQLTIGFFFCSHYISGAVYVSVERLKGYRSSSKAILTCFTRVTHNALYAGTDFLESYGLMHFAGRSGLFYWTSNKLDNTCGVILRWLLCWCKYERAWFIWIVFNHQKLVKNIIKEGVSDTKLFVGTAFKTEVKALHDACV